MGTLQWLSTTAMIAQELEDDADKRALPLLALEWHRVSNETFATASRRVMSLTGNADTEYDVFSCEKDSCTSPLGSRLRACVKTRRKYPGARGSWSPWGFDGTTRIGRIIWCLCMENDVTHVLDLFTLMGSGSALTAAHALGRKGRGEVVTVERNEEYV